MADDRQFSISIDGRPVAHLKRVAHGSPYVIWAGEGEAPAKYSERVAKAWLNTCKKYWDDVEMIPVGQVR